MRPDVERLMDCIEAQRAQNNKSFMRAWRLLAEKCPDEFTQIQDEIRAGDIRISELNRMVCEVLKGDK